jgi:hypothetical protein
VKNIVLEALEHTIRFTGIIYSCSGSRNLNQQLFDEDDSLHQVEQFTMLFLFCQVKYVITVF